ncbi:hypothetical protein [Deinococcus sedimenti]|uniref:Uncharacterized protein n=1 Tax=Deinococcus sedimenti TaxID=1867090 RepID=A0ABQ2S3U8_9DEIO|nr:hypothetical protein [Deinococcus sedimenti]GGR86399.1 hypothetical protein GCM10008960_11940 [Deinococcus sedimenti]
MFHEPHQHALDRQAQLIQEAQDAHRARAAQHDRPRRWTFRWRLQTITLRLPVLAVTAGPLR